MKIFKSILFFSILFLITMPIQAKILVCKNEDFEVFFGGKISQGTDFSVNGSLLNGAAVGGRGNKVDKAIAHKTKINFTTTVNHKSGVKAQVTFNAPLTWGTSKTSTKSSSVKYGEALLGDHSHELGRNNLYIQEVWCKFYFDDILGRDTWGHSFTLGLFSFDLGRGIALGENYATSPSSLGFYTDSAVDQYAPGAKLSGKLYWDSLKYDIYASVTETNATSFKKTGAQIYDHLIIDGKYVPNTQFARGFGDVDWKVAGRLRWIPVENKEEKKKIYFEPYAMYAKDPSQKIEFTSDAASTLKTFGLSGEFEYGIVEFGFDTAFNRGQQEVFAFDRNVVKTKTDATTGAVIQYWTNVFDDIALTTKTVYTGDTTAYRPAIILSSALNGQSIDGTTKYHGANRFRDAYKNKYRGYMVVADASIFVYGRDLKASIAAGISSGDTSPNSRTGSEATSVRKYKGFVTQQELWAGNRVKSVFVMGPAAGLIRLNPLEETPPFGSGLDSFTNIIFAGMGFNFAPKNWAHKFSIHPNIITYWQHVPSKKIAEPTVDASKRLGTEVNMINKYELTENLKLSFAAAIFMPGKYYKDIKGTALSGEILDLVKEAEAGTTEILPTLGTNTAFTLSVGIDYVF
jgi:hypothetical protein